MFEVARAAHRDRMKKGLTHTCSDDDPDERYKFVCRVLRGSRGAVGVMGFRMGDVASGAWVQAPPERVRALGGSILRAVNAANQQPVDMGAVRAWHEVFVAKWPEVRAPGGGRWMAGDRLDEAVVRRAVRYGGKAISCDEVENVLWGRAPEWVVGRMVECLRAMARDKLLPEDWRHFILCLLDKKKKSDLVDKKREVAIMSHGAKLMERACVKVALDEVTSRGLATQFGFQPGPV